MVGWVLFHAVWVDTLRFLYPSIPCIWMKTPLGDYVVYSPHKHFGDFWEVSLGNLGDSAKSSRFHRIEVGGPRPDWWDEQGAAQWVASSSPEQPALPKRPASTSAEELASLSLKDTSKKQRASDELTEAVHQPRKGKNTARPWLNRSTSQNALGDWSLVDNAVAPRSKSRPANT